MRDAIVLFGSVLGGAAVLVIFAYVREWWEERH